jgi:hypothetical protein
MPLVEDSQVFKKKNVAKQMSNKLLLGVDIALKRGIQSKKSMFKKDPLSEVKEGAMRRSYTSRRAVVFDDDNSGGEEQPF